MEEKIKAILYKYSSTMTIKGVVEETDEWIWEGEFDKVAKEIIELLNANIKDDNSIHNPSPLE